MKHHHPTDKEIRTRIQNVKQEQYRMAYMYQYEIVGRISEVCGKYTPSVDDHTFIEEEGEEFIVFIAKTAKRRGRLRPCARPLNPEYDPWAKEVYEYMQTYDKHPFLVHENPATSKTYAMNTAKEMFEGLYWPMVEYTRSVKHQYTGDMVKHTRFNDRGYEEKLVVLENGERAWTSDPDYVSIGEKVDERWKPCTSHTIRKRSIMTLLNDYGISGISAGYIAGWSLGSQHDGTPPMLKTYMHMDLSESEAALPNLVRQARRYAAKLLVPYELLG